MADRNRSPRVILASGSARRRELLAPFTSFEVLAADVDERRRPSEAAAAYALRLACEKTEAVRARHPDAVVLGADTTVVLGKSVLGKPRDEREALRMLARLSGRRHTVITGLCVVGPNFRRQKAVRTEVRMRRIERREALWYVRTGEPMDKAGAYAIQGRGGAFVKAIDGSYSNVVGLPLAEALRLLSQAGVSLLWGQK